VWFFIYCFWIVSYPISLVLDKMLGEEHKGRYNKAEFRALINLHNEATEADASAEAGQVDEELGQIGQPGLAGLRAELGARQILNRSGVAKQELRIMTGALELHRLKVKDVMLPLDEVFMLSTSTKLDVDTLQSIVNKGHSRIPVFEGHPHNVRGMLLVKRLIVLNPEEKREVGSLELLEPLVVSSNTTLLDLLYQFSSGKSHLAIITSDPDRVTQALRNKTVVPVNVHMAGIVTLEDVIERLIKHDIQDESDMTVRSQDRRMSAIESSEMASNDGDSRPSPSMVPFSGVRPGYGGATSDDLRSINSPGLFSSSTSPPPLPRTTSHTRTPRHVPHHHPGMKSSLSVPLLANHKP
jgi:metal transporter CNNM